MSNSLHTNKILAVFGHDLGSKILALIDPCTTGTVDCTKFKQCETITTLGVDPSNSNNLLYSNESGVISTISLSSIDPTTFTYDNTTDILSLGLSNGTFLTVNLGSISVSVADSSSIDLSITGANVITGVAIIDPAVDNTLSITANGLYVPPASFTSVEENIWSISGNENTNPETDFIGTTDETSLSIKTNNKERIKILENGLVGINIEDPDSALTVMPEGTRKLTGTFTYDTITQTLTGTDSLLQTELGAGFGNNGTFFGGNRNLVFVLPRFGILSINYGFGPFPSSETEWVLGSNHDEILSFTDEEIYVFENNPTATYEEILINVAKVIEVVLTRDGYTQFYNRANRYIVEADLHEYLPRQGSLQMYYGGEQTELIYSFNNSNKVTRFQKFDNNTNEYYQFGVPQLDVDNGGQNDNTFSKLRFFDNGNIGFSNLPENFIEDEILYRDENGFLKTGRNKLPISITPIKVMLSGAYDSNTGLMRTDLNTKNLIPTASPYASEDNIAEGYTINPNLVNIRTDIVDWVQVKFRDSENNIVLTRSAFVLENGDVLDQDGTLGVKTNLEGDYFISVHHRNHLTAMTLNKVDIADVVDFTDPLTALWKRDNTTNSVPTKNVNGVELLWGGNTTNDIENYDNGVIASNNNSDLDSINTYISNNAGNLTNIYVVEDVNLDGSVSSSDITFISEEVKSHPGNSFNVVSFLNLKEQTPEGIYIPNPLAPITEKIILADTDGGVGSHGIIMRDTMKAQYPTLVDADFSFNTSYNAFEIANVSNIPIIVRSTTGLNTYANHSKAYWDSVILVMPLGSNQKIELDYSGELYPWVICTGAGATQNETAFGNNLDFWDEDENQDGTYTSSFSNARIAAKLYQIWVGRTNPDMWEVIIAARETAERNITTHPDGLKWNKNNGYGKIDVAAAIAYAGTIPTKPVY